MRVTFRLGLWPTLALAVIIVLCFIEYMLPVSPRAIFNDICEMIEDRYWGSKHGWPDRHVYKYPYHPSYPDPALASADNLVNDSYKERPNGAPIYRHQVIDTTCPRFVTFELCPACGIGHKVTEHLFGVRLANLLNATYVYDEHTWLYTKHGDLDWVSDMLGIMSGEITLEEVRNRFNPWMVRPCPIDSLEPPKTRGCNVLYSAPRYPGCCSTTISSGSLTCQWSPFSNRLYASHEKMLKEKYKAATATRDMTLVHKMYDTRAVNVAWHIRIGDWVVHSGETQHYERVKTVLDEALQGHRTHWYFFSYQDNANPNRPPKDFEFLADMFGPNVTFVNNVDTADTHLLLIEADVLVGSGSGMVTLPAIYSSGVVLYHERLRFPNGMDEVPQWFMLDEDGTVHGKASAIRQQLYAHMCANDRGPGLGIAC